MTGKHFTIVGAGAIGGIVGANLAHAGHRVDFIEANGEHVRAIRARGLKLSGHREITTHHRAILPDELDGRLECVFIAVKARHTQAAIEMITPHLSSDAMVLSLQNGLEAQRIAATIGAARTLAASLTFGGYYKQPGEVFYGGTGSFRVGELDGILSARLEALATDLRAVQKVETSTNIKGFLWAKIALGVVYFATALVDADVPDIYDRQIYQKMFGQLVAEVARVAAAEGVTMQAFDGFDPQAFAAPEPSNGRAIEQNWRNQRAYWMKIEQRRTGIWRDLAIHRRKTEIDGLVGEVAVRAEAHNLAVPGMKRLIELVHGAENGVVDLGWDNLDQLVAATSRNS